MVVLFRHGRDLGGRGLRVLRSGRVQLDLELDYYVALARALDSAGDTRLRDYVACIEDPATQALRGTGGFDARGGGTCAP